MATAHDQIAKIFPGKHASLLFTRNSIPGRRLYPEGLLAIIVCDLILHNNHPLPFRSKNIINPFEK